MGFLTALTPRRLGLAQTLYRDFADDFLRRRAEDARSKEQAVGVERDAMEELKRLALERAISIVRLQRPGLHGSKPLSNAHFRSDVRKKATSLLFHAHLHLGEY